MSGGARNPDMRRGSIDVTGLYKHLVEDIRNLVQSIRRHLADKAESGQRPSPSSVALPQWEGTVIGSLSRRELYDVG
jgi:hypothetical protein